MSWYFIYLVGIVAQLLFSARLLIQWIVSEKSHKVVSPTIFWQFSMIASFLLCMYGWLRNDFAIIIGQLISYYIYIWNLEVKNFWAKIPKVMRVLFILLPIISVIYFIVGEQSIIDRLFMQEDIPMCLILFGVVGQFTFTLRFIYQWRYSRKAGESLLPQTFWVISVIGCIMIIVYAIIRHDPVLIIGQASGLVVYIRNIMIGIRADRLHQNKISINTQSSI